MQLLVELNMNEKELFNYCSKLAKKENVEFYFQKDNLEECSIEMFSVGKNTYKENLALLIKVIVNGQIGEYTISEINKNNIKLGITKSKKIAKLKNNLKIKEFGSKTSKKKIKFDKNLENVDFTELIENTKKELTKDKYIKSYQGRLIKAKNYGFYINPFLEKEEELTSISIGSIVNTRYNKPSSGGYSNIFTKVKDINIKQTFQQAKINAYNLLNPKQGIKDKYTLIFIPELTNEIINHLILPATIGEKIYKKESYLHNLKNKKIFSKDMNLFEEPHLDYFLGSQIIDDEGNKTTNKKIIEKGVFKKEIYDIYGSTLANKKPTGNGFRDSAYSSITSDYTNIILQNGKDKIENIISKTKKGILVYGLMGFHTSNLSNGDFSLTINQGKEIINGKFNNTITNLNFAGNCKENFKDFKFSKEQRFFGSGLYSFSILKNVKLI
jgi:predicted Zn-dependent protease